MKIVCILYDDPKDGMPTSYPVKELPKLEKYPDGMTLPTPKGIDFKPGELLGCVSGELGLRKFLKDRGHTLVVTSDKDAEGCVADKELVDADVVISQPFFPYYLTRKRMKSAPNLKMAITAGIGSDHVDLQAAMDHKVDVVEVTYCNSRSVAEHIVMMILSLVRDYHNQHRIVNEGGWHIADAVKRSYDVEGMHVGTIAAGRIGYDMLRKMAPFDVHLHYFDKHRLSKDKEKELNLKIKFRESFRPFAPSVLREDVFEWFELNCDSPYMLLVANVKDEKTIEMTNEQKKLFGIDKLNIKRSEIPAITHVDYSARIQTVHAETNVKYHKLISKFKQKTGCPVIVNTSFNVRGEPIVNTPEDAFNCFMGTELDTLVIGNCFLKKNEQNVSLKKNYINKYESD